MPTTGDSFPIVGGGDQLSALIAQLQQEFLRLRLRELEIPQLQLDQRARALAGMQGLSAATGYVDPRAWQKMIGGMYGAGAGTPGQGYVMPPPTPPNPEQQRYKIGTEGNVIKTLAQLRQELVAAGGDSKWNTASAEEVIAEYAKVTGYPVNPYTEGATGQAAAQATPTPPAPAAQPETPATQAKVPGATPWTQPTAPVSTPEASAGQQRTPTEPKRDIWGFDPEELWNKLRAGWAPKSVPAAAGWR